MSDDSQRLQFADFLDRLAVAKGHWGIGDHGRFVVTHYADDEIEEMRRTIVRLSINWANRDWPEINCELLLGWAKQLRRVARVPP